MLVFSGRAICIFPFQWSLLHVYAGANANIVLLWILVEGLRNGRSAIRKAGMGIICQFNENLKLQVYIIELIVMALLEWFLSDRLFEGLKEGFHSWKKKKDLS